MIGYLEGKVVDKYGQEVWLLCGAVGYRVLVSKDLFSKTKLDHTLGWYVHTHVREGAIELYGFADRAALQIFELLLGVSGIGPKSALGITDAGSAGEIISAVQQANTAFFEAVSGIGKKSAQRIIVDLKGKLGQVKELDLSSDNVEDTVVEALVALGFERKAILSVVSMLPDEMDEDEKIREGLKRLGR